MLQTKLLVPLHGLLSVDTSDPNTANKMKVTQKTDAILLWVVFNSDTNNQPQYIEFQFAVTFSALNTVLQNNTHVNFIIRRDRI